MKIEIPNRITAKEAAIKCSQSSDLLAQGVDTIELANFLTMCYGEIAERVKNRDLQAILYLESYDGLLMGEAIRILKEDGYGVVLTSTHFCRLMISWQHELLSSN